MTKIRRGSIEIAMAILHAMTKSSRITHIIHIANTSYVLVQKRLKKFRELGLVDPARNILTPKGVNTLQFWFELTKTLEMEEESKSFRTPYKERLDQEAK